MSPASSQHAQTHAQSSSQKGFQPQGLTKLCLPLDLVFRHYLLPTPFPDLSVNFPVSSHSPSRLSSEYLPMGINPSHTIQGQAWWSSWNEAVRIGPNPSWPVFLEEEKIEIQWWDAKDVKSQKDTARRWPSARQGETLQNKQSLLTPWSWTSSLQKCEVCIVYTTWYMVCIIATLAKKYNQSFLNTASKTILSKLHQLILSFA
jgi:hypothetical protein